MSLMQRLGKNRCLENASVVLITLVANCIRGAGMADNDKIFDEEKIDEEDLLDFEFDDLDDLIGEDLSEEGDDFSSDDDIIELVDIIKDEDAGADDIEQLLDIDEGSGEQGAEEELDLGLDDLDEITEDEGPKAMETDLDSAFGDIGDVELEPVTETIEIDEADEDAGADDIEQLLDIDEGFGLEAIEKDSEGVASSEEALLESDDLSDSAEPGEGLAAEEISKETDEGMQTGPVKEDLSDILPDSEEEGLDKEEAAASHATEELVGISEEKIEEIITRVLEGVVEKVARETMVTVAEKIIGEAIDALKESLESSEN